MSDAYAEMLKTWQEGIARMIHDPAAAQQTAAHIAGLLDAWSRLAQTMPSAYAAPHGTAHPPASTTTPAAAASAAGTAAGMADSITLLHQRLDAIEQRLARIEVANQSD